MTSPKTSRTQAQEKAVKFVTRPFFQFEADRGKAVVGDVMPDGTIYAGISPDTKKPIYAAPSNALHLSFNGVARYAENLEINGKKGFRAPSKEELNVLFKNREKGALKKTFNLTGSDPDGYYWSSTMINRAEAWNQNFLSGEQISSPVWGPSSLRCIRD